MIKFNKDFNAKIISLVVAVLFIFNSAAYGIDLPRNTPPDKLRVPVGESNVYKRITEAIKTWEEQEALIDPNLDTAHKDNRAKLLHKTEKGTKVIEEVHNFLRKNRLEKAVVLFEGLKDRAVVEVPGWHKGGLWLVTPKPDEALPNEHVSDKGGIHIVAYPGVDIACTYVHGMAAYVGLNHEQAEALEKAFIEWRTKKNLIPEELKEKFREGIKERNKDPLLLTHLSEREKEGAYQRDYSKVDELAADKRAYLNYILWDLASKGIIDKGLSINSREVVIIKIPGTNVTTVYLLKVKGKNYILKHSTWPWYNKYINNQWEILKRINPEGENENISSPLTTGIGQMEIDGKQQQIAYIVTDYFEGQDLFELIRNKGPMTFNQAIAFGIRLSKLVKHIHEQGVIVRELKPENIIIMQNEKIGLFDFNVSMLPNYDWDEDRLKLKETVGHGYADDDFVRPKERRRPDVRSDIFTIGMDLFYAVTGKEYYQGIHREKVGLDLVKDDILRKIIARAIGPREKRYENIDELMEDLVKAANSLNEDGEALAAVIGQDSHFANRYKAFPNSESRIEFLLEQYQMPGVKVDVEIIPSSPYVLKDTGLLEKIGTKHYKITLIGVEHDYCQEYLLFHEFMHVWLEENGFTFSWNVKNVDIVNYLYGLRDLINDYLIEKENRRRFGNYYLNAFKDLRDYDLQGNFSGEGVLGNIIIFMLAITSKAVSLLYPELSDSLSANLISTVIRGSRLNEIMPVIAAISIDNSAAEYEKTVIAVHNLLTEDDAKIKDGIISIDATAVAEFVSAINALMTQIQGVLEMARQREQVQTSI